MRTRSQQPVVHCTTMTDTEIGIAKVAKRGNWVRARVKKEHMKSIFVKIF